MSGVAQQLTETQRDDGAAAVLLLIELASIRDGHTADFEPTLDGARQEWGRRKQMLDDPLWSDGKHLGDCTLDSMTCGRCYVEEARGAELDRALTFVWEKL